MCKTDSDNVISSLVNLHNLSAKQNTLSPTKSTFDDSSRDRKMSWGDEAWYFPNL